MFACKMIARGQTLYDPCCVARQVWEVRSQKAFIHGGCGWREHDLVSAHNRQMRLEIVLVAKVSADGGDSRLSKVDRDSPRRAGDQNLLPDEIGLQVLAVFRLKSRDRRLLDF